MPRQGAPRGRGEGGGARGGARAGSRSLAHLAQIDQAVALVDLEDHEFELLRAELHSHARQELAKLRDRDQRVAEDPPRTLGVDAPIAKELDRLELARAQGRFDAAEDLDRRDARAHVAFVVVPLNSRGAGRGRGGRGGDVLHLFRSRARTVSVIPYPPLRGSLGSSRRTGSRSKGDSQRNPDGGTLPHPLARAPRVAARRGPHLRALAVARAPAEHERG